MIKWLWKQFPTKIAPMAEGSVHLDNCIGFKTPKGTTIYYGSFKYWLWCHNGGDWN